MSFLHGWINRDTASFIAILFSPLIAWGVQYWRNKRDVKIARKLEIFRYLMVTRGSGQTQSLSREHVAALNSIDIEFYREKDVLDAWDVYREHLLHPNLPTESMSDEQKNIMLILWHNEARKHLVNLLYAIARVLGYKKLSKITLEKKMYVPQAYDNLESDQYSIRKGCLAVLEGKKSIKVDVLRSEQQ